MGPYAGVDYNLTLRPFQSRLQQIYHIDHGKPYARVDHNPMLDSILTLCQSRPFSMDMSSEWKKFSSDANQSGYNVNNRFYQYSATNCTVS